MDEQNDFLKIIKNIEAEQKAQTKKLDEFIQTTTTKMNNMETALRQAEETMRLLLANKLLDEIEIENVPEKAEENVKSKPLIQAVNKDSVKTETNNTPNNAEELYNLGMDARNKNDWKTALSYFTEAHKKGNINATIELANIYKNGTGVSQNYSKAFEYLKLAHENGNTNATTELADMYRDGTFVKQNYSKAFELYNYAAIKNNQSAMFQLFFAYVEGYGVQRNLDIAIKWLEKAANMGYTMAMLCMEKTYCGNYGFQANYDEAKRWYNKILASPTASYFVKGRASSELAYLCYSVDNYDQAFRLYKESADLGDRDAMFWLGIFYEKGYSVNKDDLIAKEWYEKAADDGDAEAMDRLGDMYRQGRPGITQNYRVARKWYKKAAGLGNDSSMLYLGYMYDVGEGIKADKSQAVEWYNQAVAAGNTIAMCNLAYLYENGDGVIQNYKKAMQLYQKAAEAGDRHAMYSMGDAYYNGVMTRKDNVKARSWYEKAYAAGHEDAEYALRKMGYNDYSLAEIKVRHILVEQLGVEEDEIEMDSDIVDDLGADSLDIVELIMALEEEFNLEIPDEDAEGMRTVEDILDYIYSNLD